LTLNFIKYIMKVILIVGTRPQIIKSQLLVNKILIFFDNLTSYNILSRNLVVITKK